MDRENRAVHTMPNDVHSAVQSKMYTPSILNMFTATYTLSICDDDQRRSTRW